MPRRRRARAATGGAGRRGGLSGSIADALRNIQRYAGGDVLENQQGGAGQFGPSIQFDTKGVEFGPWIRRFVAQIKRNWLIPLAAMAMKGHVVLTFNVHKDGRITDLTVVDPCHDRRVQQRRLQRPGDVEPDATRCRPSTRRIGPSSR